MNFFEYFLIEVMAVQPEAAHAMLKIVSFAGFVMFVGLFAAVTANALAALPLSLNRLFDRLSRSEQECSELKRELQTEIRARKSLERRLDALEREHAQQLTYHQQCIEELGRAMQEDRKPNLMYTKRYEYLRQLLS